jgi:hypothetical protein
VSQLTSASCPSLQAVAAGYPCAALSLLRLVVDRMNDRMNGEGGRRRDGKEDKLMGGPEGMRVLRAEFAKFYLANFVFCQPLKRYAK